MQTLTSRGRNAGHGGRNAGHGGRNAGHGGRNAGHGSRPARTARRLAAAAAALTGFGVLALTLGAGPAAAVATPIGQNGSTAPIPTVAIILIFVGIPLIVMIIGALGTLPARAVGALRYRPGRTWGYAREWFGSKPEQVVDITPEAAAIEVTGGARASW